jgi:hypothetical protein
MSAGVSTADFSKENSLDHQDFKVSITGIGYAS